MLAYRLTEPRVAPGIAPCVQLNCGITKRKALVDDIKILSDRTKRNGACIRGDAGAERSQKLMHRLTCMFACDIPEGGVDEALNVDWELFDTIKFPQAVPDPFAAQRVLTDEFS